MATDPLTGPSITITDTEQEAGVSSTAYTEPRELSNPSRSTTGGGGLVPGMYVLTKGMHSTKGTIISVREKHGSFRTAVPCMPLPVALVCYVFNIFTPGLGTLISAFTVFCCGFTETTAGKAFLWNILAAFLQAISFIFIVGWIWSISWGITFVTLAAEYSYEQSRHTYKPASPA